MEIHCHLSKNFLGDTILYSADLLQQLREFESKFPGLAELDVDLKEIAYQATNHNSTTPIQFLNNNRRLEIKLTFHSYFDPKGKPYDKPSVWMVYNQLRFILNKAADEYKALTN
ncbi:hypothetical protein [Mucilaginibacter paludis]|uniref:Uncharacterized protein n=1 Tax=Mucilaginibacter paludis DSM 18603 TaxID=714943 RepID=H1YDS6_9SPHI|nr:hypothetical protein [Mucilaginibacter paludis]EHQ24266.1 hypothetical protein Mucpa_0063 [Mucilaginibacter paludis DSM 18603]